ncbi:MAG TPA: serine/threonine-protein kinase [Methylomirabilota bacterium]|nr:serine/threonine-protein kinase [Methylomirabilota bacterium]
MIRKLGGSGLGAVYLAEEVATGNQVAVKVLLSEIPRDMELVKQFWWEARLAAASSPSHIVRVFEVDRTDEGRVFIAMEYLEGESLGEMIRREGALEPQRALRLAIQIAQGLAAASQAGVTHRNLKPQNVIVVGPDEQVKLTDFGVGRLRETALGARLTGPSLLAPEYIAPEQLRGDDVSFRADIWALGALLYTMLTGSAPSPDMTPVRRLRPEVPEALEQFVMRAMERRPERRPGGIEEVIGKLKALAASEPLPPPEPETEASPLRPHELAPTGLLTLLREDPWPPRFVEWRLLALELVDHARAGVWQSWLGRLKRSALGGWQRLRLSGGRWWSRRGRAVVIGATALFVVGIGTWAFLDWWAAVRGKGPSPNERRREEAQAARPATPEGRDEEGPARVRAGQARVLLARSAEPATVNAQPPERSAEELFRVRTQVQQKLHRRGLFRVSTADRWGVTLEIGSRGEVILSGLLPDMALYNEALRLVREVPGIGEVQAANLRVAGAATQ